jgi:hypothetical protein
VLDAIHNVPEITMESVQDKANADMPSGCPPGRPAMPSCLPPLPGILHPPGLTPPSSSSSSKSPDLWTLTRLTGNVDWLGAGKQRPAPSQPTIIE